MESCHNNNTQREIMDRESDGSGGGAGIAVNDDQQRVMMEAKDNDLIMYNFTMMLTAGLVGSGTGDGNSSDHLTSEADAEAGVQHIVSIVVVICFGLIGLAGLFGNCLVVLGEEFYILFLQKEFLISGFIDNNLCFQFQ